MARLEAVAALQPEALDITWPVVETIRSHDWEDICLALARSEDGGASMVARILVAQEHDLVPDLAALMATQIESGKARELAKLAILEYLVMPGACPACNGTGGRAKCPTCGGAGRKGLSERARAMQLGVNGKAWQRTWRGRYFLLAIPVLTRYLAELRRLLRQV